MKHIRFLFYSLFIAAGLVALVLTAVLAMRPATASAQDPQSPWLSSADPPEELAAQWLSSPDLAAPAGVDETNTPEALLQLRSHRVTGSALRPRDSTAGFNVGGDGGCIYPTNSSSDVFNTPVWLPQGSHVDTLRMYYDDTSASNSTAWFTIYDLYGNIVQEWSVSSSGSSGNGFNDTAVISHTLDYSIYSYLLNWRPNTTGTTMQLCGFRIFFEPPPFGASFLPLGVRND